MSRKLPVTIDKLFFILSPFLALPLVLRGIFHENKTSLVLFCMCIGFLSFGYIPGQGNDKAYYLYLYNLYQNMPASEFFGEFLQSKTDVVFYTILYVTAKLNIPFEFFSLFITFITSYLLLIVFYEQSLASSNNKKQAFLFFSIAILAISLPALLSGMRNYLSVAFVFYGFHLLVTKEHVKKSVLFILLGVITHFSSLLYVVVALMYRYFNHRLVKICFFMSLVFIFLPKSILLNASSLVDLPDVYGTRAEGYLSSDSAAEINLAVGNFNNYLRVFINGLWFYVALAFCLLNIKNKEKLFIFFVCLMSVINIISSSPDLLPRYGMLGSLALLITLFYVKKIRYRKFFIYLILIVNFLGFSVSIMGLREPLGTSVFKVEYLTLPTIFFIDATTEAGDKH